MLYLITKEDESLRDFLVACYDTIPAITFHPVLIDGDEGSKCRNGGLTICLFHAALFELYHLMIVNLLFLYLMRPRVRNAFIKIDKISQGIFFLYKSELHGKNIPYS